MSVNPTKTQMVGGNFQDSEGNPLANGTLTLVLNNDENISGVGNVCSGIAVTLQLDSGGNIASSSSTPPAADQYIWATDVMEPTNAYYTVTGYAADGQPSWGPNNQQITSEGAGGGIFNAGTWVPNYVISWNPPVQSVVLQTNGTNNDIQTLLNLQEGTGVTLSESGGTVTIDAAGGGIVSGTSVFPLADTIWASPASTFDAFPWTVATRVPGTSLVSFPSIWKIVIEILVNGGENLGQIQDCCIKRTMLDSDSVVDTTPITWGGTPSPTLGVGVFTSDAITLALDPLHDYYFMWFTPFVSNNDVVFQPFNTFLAEGGRYGSNGAINHTSDTTLNAGLNGDNFGCVIKQWFAA